MTDEHHMNLMSSWDEDLFALERNFPEEYAPYRMAIRIAELEATVTRLTAPVGQDEATEAWNAWRMVEHPDEGMTSVLTAFLERRIKG
jgi:hypothetical protein